MRSDLLLFTRVASSILAVCPFPMNTLDGSSSLVHTKTEIIVTLVDGKTGLQLERTGPKTVADRETHAIILQKRKSLTKSIITRALRIKATPKYKGLYAPRDPEGRRWIYFTLTGWNGCGPCFGWKALGYTFKADGGKINEYGQVYIGISSGEPAHGRFKLVMSHPLRPDQLQEDLQADKRIEATKREWRVLFDEFKAYFMAPTVTFIGHNGAPKLPGSERLLDETQHMFTNAINDALHVHFQITYQNYYDPEHVESDPHLLWRYFELIGGDPRCTTVSLCFGFYTTECLAILKPSPLQFQARFQTLGVYGINCKEMTAKFENRFMRGHVWHNQPELDLEE